MGGTYEKPHPRIDRSDSGSPKFLASKRPFALAARFSLFGPGRGRSHLPATTRHQLRVCFLLEDPTKAFRKPALSSLGRPWNLDLRPLHDGSQRKLQRRRLFSPRRLASCFNWNLSFPDFLFHDVDLRWNSRRSLARQRSRTVHVIDCPTRSTTKERNYRIGCLQEISRSA